METKRATDTVDQEKQQRRKVLKQVRKEVYMICFGEDKQTLTTSGS